jgi:hypothetical protein
MFIMPKKLPPVSAALVDVRIMNSSYNSICRFDSGHITGTGGDITLFIKTLYNCKMLSCHTDMLVFTGQLFLHFALQSSQNKRPHDRVQPLNNFIVDLPISLDHIGQRITEPVREFLYRPSNVVSKRI